MLATPTRPPRWALQTRRPGNTAGVCTARTYVRTPVTTMAHWASTNLAAIVLIACHLTPLPRLALAFFGAQKPVQCGGLLSTIISQDEVDYVPPARVDTTAFSSHCGSAMSSRCHDPFPDATPQE